MRSKFDKIIKYLSTLKHTECDRKLMRNFINELYILKHHDVVDNTNIRHATVNSPPLFRSKNNPTDYSKITNIPQLDARHPVLKSLPDSEKKNIKLNE